MSRLTRRTAASLGLAALASPAVLRDARGQAPTRWRMVTSWPKNLPGPGMTAERLAARIRSLSGGRLDVTVYASGELVGALEVFDAVSGGAAEMGHTASFYWQGKIPAAVFFTTVPFGLTPLEHMAWIEHGGGQGLWDELYRPAGLKPFMAGNSGMQMGGWFVKPIRSLDDVKGLKLRMPGLGGEVFRHLGATPVSTAPSEILPALTAGTVDGAEFLGPWSDAALGLYRVAPYYYWPGFNKPNGTGEAIVSLKAWEALPADLKAIVRDACAVEHSLSLAEAEWNDGRALAQLVERHRVQLTRFPDDLLAAAKTAAEQVLDALAAKDASAARILASYRQARAGLGRWSAISVQPFLAVRGG